MLGMSGVDRLEMNLDVIEDGPLRKEMVELVEDVWESVRGSAAACYL